MISEERPNITSLRVGDMASGPRPGGLQSFHSSYSLSSTLAGVPNDLHPSFPGFQNGVPRGNRINNTDLIAAALRGKLNLFLVKSQ